MEDFKSLDYQYNDFEEEEEVENHHTNDMDAERRPNFQALLNARESSGGFRPSLQIQRVPTPNDRGGQSLNEIAARNGQSYSGLSQSDKNTKTLNSRTQAERSTRTINVASTEHQRDARPKETVSNKNQQKIHHRGTNDNNESPNNDEVDRLVMKIKSEYNFYDWRSVEAKLRNIFEEDQMKANDSKTEARDKERLVDTFERNIDSQLDRYRSAPNSDQTKRSDSPVASDRDGSIQSAVSETRVTNHDHYSTVEAYTDYMVRHRDPSLADKWGDQGQRARPLGSGENHVNPIGNKTGLSNVKGATANEHADKDLVFNKNLRRTKNATPCTRKTENINTRSYIGNGGGEAERARTIAENSDDKLNSGDKLNASADEIEANKNQPELQEWVGSAQEWGKKLGLPELKPIDQQGIDDEQSISQMHPQGMSLLGKGQEMLFSGVNSFPGGRNVFQGEQSATGMLQRFPAVGYSGQQQGSFGGQNQAYQGANELSQGWNARGGDENPKLHAPTGRQDGGHGTSNELPGMDPDNMNENSGEFLKQVLAYETVKAKNSPSPKSDGMCTVIIIETSSSVAGESVLEIGQFLAEFINGVEANHHQLQLRENVAVINVGKEPGVLQHLTTDYARIRRVIDSLQFEGPNPLFTGIMLVIAALAGHGANGISTFDGHYITPRIILISSGFASGKAEGQWQQNNEAQQMLCADILQNVTEDTMARLFSVPVGQANKEFLESIAGMTGGKLMSTADAKLMSRSYIHHRASASLRRTRGSDISDRSSIDAALRNEIPECTDADVDCVIEILSQGEPDLLGRERRMEQKRNSAMQQQAQQAQQGQMNEMQKMMQLQQMLGAMQGQGDEGLVDLLSQVQQGGAAGRATLEELLRAMPSTQAGGGPYSSGQGGSVFPPSQGMPLGRGHGMPNMSNQGAFMQYGGSPQLGRGGIPLSGHGGIPQTGRGGGMQHLGGVMSQLDGGVPQTGGGMPYYRGIPQMGDGSQLYGSQGPGRGFGQPGGYGGSWPSGQRQ